MKTIQARVTKNIKEDPSVEECDIWNIEATFLEALPDDAMRITTDPAEIGVNQLEEARADSIALFHYDTNTVKIPLAAWRGDPPRLSAVLINQKKTCHMALPARDLG